MNLILVVEDEYGHAEMLKLLLESHGYRVVLAANGKEALPKLALEKPSLILSDFMMPHMTGAELGRALRADPMYQDIPIIMQSGTSEQVVRRAFSDYDIFIAKPYDLDALLERVAKLIEFGRPKPAARDPEVDQTMRQLLKAINIPPQE